MEDQRASEKHPRKLAQALDLMMEAQDYLDEFPAPGEIGAHLDLAICRLREHLCDIYPTP